MVEPKGTGDHEEGTLIPALLPTASGHLAGTSLTEPSPMEAHRKGRVRAVWC